MQQDKHPISKIEWVDVHLLKANDYNPNVVYTHELNLLKFSILKQGWIQPILVTQDLEIIDGYHRVSLCKTDKDIAKLTDNKVPVVKMQMEDWERKCLTIRINRAKGSHIAVKMSDIIKSLVHDHNMDIKQIAKEIGATKKELDVLLMDNVFKALDVENKTFSNAWYPTR